MKNSEYAIEVKHLNKTFRIPSEKSSTLKERIIHPLKRIKYREQNTLTDINFKIKKGEFFGVVGRNGSGKSTLLKILSGIYVPDSGDVVIEGKLTPFIELGVGFNMELTGRENVFLNGALFGFSREEMEGMYDDIVSFAELQEFMDLKLKNYSSGMQVRLAFSIAIRAKSDILLLDEVLAVGDASFQKKCFEYFKLLKKNNETVILVTHDMDAIREYCDKAILINEGRVLCHGEPKKIAQEYLKLFNSEVENTGSKRWGNGKAHIKNVKTILKNSKIILSSEFVANEAINNPIIGVQIHNLAGQMIFESNTKWESIKTGKLKSGDVIKSKIIIPDDFAGGRHEVTVAISDSTGLEVYEWWDSATEFDNYKEQRSSALTNINHEIIIKGIK